jgi:hypothetical protein
VLTTAVLALLGYLKVRRIRGPQQTIESVKEARVALIPGGDKSAAAKSGTDLESTTDPSGW